MRRYFGYKKDLEMLYKPPSNRFTKGAALALLLCMLVVKNNAQDCVDSLDACGEFISAYQYLCYQDYIYERCCETCAIVSRQIENCSYGDHEIDFCNNQTKTDCQTLPLVNSTCCETCPVLLSIPDSTTTSLEPSAIPLTDRISRRSQISPPEMDIFSTEFDSSGTILARLISSSTPIPSDPTTATRQLTEELTEHREDRTTGMNFERTYPPTIKTTEDLTPRPASLSSTVNDESTTGHFSTSTRSITSSSETATMLYEDTYEMETEAITDGPTRKRTTVKMTTENFKGSIAMEETTAQINESAIFTSTTQKNVDESTIVDYNTESETKEPDSKYSTSKSYSDTSTKAFSTTSNIPRSQTTGTDDMDTEEPDDHDGSTTGFQERTEYTRTTTTILSTTEDFTEHAGSSTIKQTTPELINTDKTTKSDFTSIVTDKIFTTAHQTTNENIYVQTDEPMSKKEPHTSEIGTMTDEPMYNRSSTTVQSTTEDYTFPTIKTSTDLTDSTMAEKTTTELQISTITDKSSTSTVEMVTSEVSIEDPTEEQTNEFIRTSTTVPSTTEDFTAPKTIDTTPFTTFTTTSMDTDSDNLFTDESTEYQKETTATQSTIEDYTSRTTNTTSEFAITTDDREYSSSMPSSTRNLETSFMNTRTDREKSSTNTKTDELKETTDLSRSTSTIPSTAEDLTFSTASSDKTTAVGTTSMLVLTTIKLDNDMTTEVIRDTSAVPPTTKDYTQSTSAPIISTSTDTLSTTYDIDETTVWQQSTGSNQSTTETNLFTEMELTTMDDTKQPGIISTDSDTTATLTSSTVSDTNRPSFKVTTKTSTSNFQDSTTEDNPTDDYMGSTSEEMLETKTNSRQTSIYESSSITEDSAMSSSTMSSSTISSSTMTANAMSTSTASERSTSKVVTDYTAIAYSDSTVVDTLSSITTTEDIDLTSTGTSKITSLTITTKPSTQITSDATNSNLTNSTTTTNEFMSTTIMVDLDTSPSRSSTMWTTDMEIMTTPPIVVEESTTIEATTLTIKSRPTTSTTTTVMSSEALKPTTPTSGQTASILSTILLTSTTPLPAECATRNLFDGDGCEQFVSAVPSLCYKDETKQKCCTSCYSQADRERPDCLYGDQGDICKQVTVEECHSSAIASTLCCRTCSLVLTTTSLSSITNTSLISTRTPAPSTTFEQIASAVTVPIKTVMWSGEFGIIAIVLIITAAIIIALIAGLLVSLRHTSRIDKYAMSMRSSSVNSDSETGATTHL